MSENMQTVLVLIGIALVTFSIGWLIGWAENRRYEKRMQP